MYNLGKRDHLRKMTQIWTLQFILAISVIFGLIPYGLSVRHARNLIWSQTPTLKTGVSRIVGIEGTPTDWVTSGDVSVRHISAPHIGWQFKALAFNYATQTLYWTEATNKKIQGLRLNGTSDTNTVFSGTSNLAEGLAVDWLSNNIYWTDSLYNWILMSPLGGNVPVYRLIVRTELTNPHSVVVYPQKGYLFWTDWGDTMSKIEVSDLLGGNRRTIIKDDILHPRGITIDFTDQALYWVDSKKDTIETADFSGNGRRVVAFQSGTIFYGIAIFQNYIFVTEQLQGHLRVYDKKTGTNEVNYQLGYVPDGIVMYDENLQVGNSSDCEEAGCMHICVKDPQAGPICRCGEGYALQSDGVSCKVEQRFVTPSHLYSIRDAICLYPVNLPDMSLQNITLQSQCFLQNGNGHYGLTYDASEHVLFYSENVTNSIGSVNMQLSNLNLYGKTIIKGVGDVQGMAYDWVSKNLFWTDLKYNHISMARQDGMYPTVVLEGLDQPLGIVVHPERGKVYWTERGSTNMIFSANMDGSDNQTLVNASEVGIPNHLYYDIAKDRLYWADSGLYSIRCVDMNTNTVSVIYKSMEESTTFFGITLYQDYVLWTDQDDMKNGIHAARMDKQEKVRGILHPHVGVAADLITFDQMNQPDMTSACGNNNGLCDHLCIPTSNVSRICACGVGYTLDENLRTCSSRPETDNYVLTVDSYQKQIYQIKLDTGTVRAIPLVKSYKGVAIDINPFTNTIYWSDNSASVIMSAAIDGFGEAPFIKLSNNSVSDGIAVDYTNQLLFYTCTNQDIIVVVSLANPNIYKTIINESLQEPRDILVHPEQGRIYWTDWGEEPKIETATMDGGNRSVLLKLTEKKSWPNAIALDTKSMNLFWVDAQSEMIGQINVNTRVKKVLFNETRAHYFGLALMGQYLYLTDWFKRHVSRINISGGELEKVGPSKFSRLNGIVAYKKSEMQTVFGLCLRSQCSHLCIPVSDKAYKCMCADENLDSIPCTEQYDKSGHAKHSDILFKHGGSGRGPALTIALSVLGIVAVICIAVAAVYFYNRRCRSADIRHDKLVEDTSRVDTFYRITFPDGNKDEPNFDSGIENPSFSASSEDIQTSGNIVRHTHTPM